MGDKNLSTPIQFLKGVDEKRAELLSSELNLDTFEDLLHYYPFRYIDRSRYYTIRELTATPTQVQIRGRFTRKEELGTGNKRRLKAVFSDNTGSVECIWFKGISFITKQIKPNVDYVLFGKPTLFNNRLNFTHPEFEQLDDYLKKNAAPFTPVYPLTEKIKKFKFTSRVIQKLTYQLLTDLKSVIKDFYPETFRKKYNLMDL